MKHTFHSYGRRVTCEKFYYEETGAEGVDVLIEGSHVGAITGLPLPNPTVKDNVDMFIDAVQGWLDKNYWSKIK